MDPISAHGGLSPSDVEIPPGPLFDPAPAYRTLPIEPIDRAQALWDLRERRWLIVVETTAGERHRFSVPIPVMVRFQFYLRDILQRLSGKRTLFGPPISADAGRDCRDVDGEQAAHAGLYEGKSFAGLGVSGEPDMHVARDIADCTIDERRCVDPIEAPPRHRLGENEAGEAARDPLLEEEAELTNGLRHEIT